MIYRFGEFSLDDQLFGLSRGDKPISLEPRVFDLLAYLILQRHRVVSKAELFECLWEGRKVSEGSLTVAVAAARKALGDSHINSRMIVTHHGRGYRFSADVTEVRSSSVENLAAHLHREPRGFVGREDELALLGTCLDAARQGRRQICLVSGEPGIGKSRLAEEFIQVANKRKATVLKARCLEADGAPPFWPWIQILREQFRLDGLPSGLPESVRTELARLVLEYGAAPTGAEADQDPMRARFRLFDAVAYLIREAASGAPLVLLIDDVHRADKPSLLMLEFVATQLRDSRLLVIMTDRDMETQKSPIHSQILGAICREAGSRAVLLSGLNSIEIDQFIRSSGAASSTGSDPHALQELTGGNPFFLTQLLPFLDELTQSGSHKSVRPLPATIRDAVSSQLDGLAESTREVLSVAAVVGRDFSQHLLRLATKQLLGTADAIAEACSARIVFRHPDADDWFRFSHVLVRDALYERLTPQTRSSLHCRVAAALNAISGDAPDEQLLQVAHHLYHGVADADAVEVIGSCARAGAIASAILAYEESVVQYRRAIELSEIYLPTDAALKCDLHLSLGAEYARTGERSSAQAAFKVAAEVAASIDDDFRFARAALGAFPGFFAVEAGAPDAFAIGLLREGLRRVGAQDLELRALLLARLAMALAWSDEGEERMTLSAEAASLASASGDPALELQVLLARWFAEWTPDRFDERWRIAEELMERARVGADRETLLLCRLFWVTCLLERGDMGEFMRQVAVFEEAAEVLRQPEALWYAALLRSVHALNDGRLADAEVLSARFAEIGALVGDANAFHSRMSHKIILAWEAGLADALVDGALQGAESYPGMVGWRAAYAWCLAQAGRHHDARREFKALARAGFDRIPKRMDWSLTIAFLADVAADLDAKEEAPVLYDLLVPLRGRNLVLGLCVANWGCPSRHLGRLALVMGREPEAASLLLEAIEVDDRAGARAWAARSRYEFARMAYLSHNVELKRRADRFLLEARQTAESLGLADLSRRLDALTA